jgi:hypothetical protein
MLLEKQKVLEAELGMDQKIQNCTFKAALGAKLKLNFEKNRS